LDNLRSRGIDPDRLTPEMLKTLSDGNMHQPLEQVVLMQHIQKTASGPATAPEAAPKLQLPCHDLAKSHIIDSERLGKFDASKSMPRDLGLGSAGSPGQPVPVPFDPRLLETEHWLQVLLQCGLTRGRHWPHDLTSPSSKHLLLPSNNDLSCFFSCSCIAEEYSADVVLDNTLEKSLSVSGIEVLAHVPSESLLVKGETGIRTGRKSVQAGETYTMIRKYHSPVCHFNIDLDDDVVLKAASGEETGGPKFTVNPNFFKDVSKVLGEIEAADGSSVQKAALLESELGARVFSKYGNVLVTSCLLGVGILHKETTRSASEVESDYLTTQARVSLSNFFFAGGAALGSSNAAESQHEGTHHTSMFQAIAGTVSDSDPRSIAKFRNDPTSWRAIDIKKFMPVLALLPMDLKLRINNLLAIPANDFMASMAEAYEEARKNRKEEYEEAGDNVIDYELANRHAAAASKLSTVSQGAGATAVSAGVGQAAYAANMQEAAKAFQETGVSISGMAQQGALNEASSAMSGAAALKASAAVSAVFFLAESAYLYHKWGKGDLTPAEFQRSVAGAFTGTVAGTAGGVAGAWGGAAAGVGIGSLAGPAGGAVGGVVGGIVGSMGGGIGANIAGRKAGEALFTAIHGDTDTEKNEMIVKAAMEEFELLHIDPWELTPDQVKREFKHQVLIHHPDKVIRRDGESEKDFEARREAKTVKTTKLIHHHEVLMAFITNRNESVWQKLKKTLQDRISSARPRQMKSLAAACSSDASCAACGGKGMTFHDRGFGAWMDGRGWFDIWACSRCGSGTFMSTSKEYGCPQRESDLLADGWIKHKPVNAPS